MVYRGHVRNGKIELDDPLQLPDGSEVEVRPVEQTPPIPTLYERLKDVIGIAEGLPADLAENHDHYIHSAPKRT
jgi:hypothetical protein